MVKSRRVVCVDTTVQQKDSDKQIQQEFEQVEHE